MVAAGQGRRAPVLSKRTILSTPTPMRRRRPGAPRRSLVLLAVAALPTIAAARPEPPPPRVDMPAAYVGGSAGASLPAAALDQWWRLFGDPILDALEDEAFRTAPDTL